MSACRRRIWGGWGELRRTTTFNKRVPPALTAFAPGNTARTARRVGTLGRYVTARGRCGGFSRDLFMESQKDRSFRPKTSTRLNTWAYRFTIFKERSRSLTRDGLLDGPFKSFR